MWVCINKGYCRHSFDRLDKVEKGRTDTRLDISQTDFGEDTFTFLSCRMTVWTVISRLITLKVVSTQLDKRVGEMSVTAYPVTQFVCLFERSNLISLDLKVGHANHVMVRQLFIAGLMSCQECCEGVCVSVNSVWNLINSLHFNAFASSKWRYSLPLSNWEVQKLVRNHCSRYSWKAWEAEWGTKRRRTSDTLNVWYSNEWVCNCFSNWKRGFFSVSCW